MNNNGSKKYYYKVFELKIQSEILLNGLTESNPTATPDVVLQFGKVELPEDNLPDLVYDKNWMHKENLLFVKIPQGIGAFMVKKEGHRTDVFFDLKIEHKMQTALAWFYGIVLSGVLQMNNLFALHASGIIHDGQLHLFCGNSGMGKSTIAAQLRSRGYPLFTDDKCVVQWNDLANAYLASPGLPIMRLWKNSEEQIEHEDFLTDRVPAVYKSNKSQFRIKASALVQQAQPLKKIFILVNIPEEKSLNCIPLTGIRKVRFLRKQIFREDMIKGFGKEQFLWDFLQLLVRKIPVFLLLRPRKTPIPVFGDFVEQVLKEEIACNHLK